MKKTWPILIVPLVFLSPYSTQAQVPHITLTASNGQARSEFGYKVAASDSVLITSAWKEDASLGAAYVFTRSVHGWTETMRFTSGYFGRNQSDFFGSDVAVNDDYYFVGSAHRTGEVGSVFAFARDSSNPEVLQLIEPSPPIDGGLFGWSLEATDDLLLVGTLGASSESAYVFTHNAGTWEQAAILTPPESDNVIDFGRAVAVVDSLIFVGAPLYQQDGVITGAVFVYTFATSGIVLEQIILPDNSPDLSHFGISLSAYDQGLAVSASRYQNVSDSRGAVYLYARIESEYVHSQTIVSPRSDDSSFADEVSLSDSLLAVSSHADSGSGIFIYSANDEEWTYEMTTPDVFGDVEISGDHLFIGDIRFHGSVWVYDRSALVTAVETISEVPRPAKLLELRSYPNPATHQVTVVLPQATGRTFSLEVVNVLGQRIYKREVSTNELMGNHLQLVTSEWLPGIYFIRFFSGKHVYGGTVIRR